MNKTTTTLLTAAGLIFLAGCKTEVMGDRRYKDVPQDDPVVQQPVERPVEKAPAPAPVAPRFKPMGGEFSGEGIEDVELCRKASGKKAPRCTGLSAKGGIYVVKRGDTLGRIARRHGVSLQALREANKRTPAQDRFLRPGTKLVIPGGKALKSGKGAKSAAAAPARKITGKLNADGTYTIVKGDNIPKIARKFGIRAKALQAANNLSDEATTRLQIGQKLIIPTGADARYTGKKSAVRSNASKKNVKKPVSPEVTSPAPAPTPAPVPVDGAAATPPPAEQPVPATAPAPAPVADGDTAAVLPPAAESASAAGTQFVSVAGYKDLAEFAAKHNTTIEELCKLNPRLNPAEPLAVNEMLYVPKK